MEDLHRQNVKIVLRKIKESLSKLRNIPYSWIVLKIQYWKVGKILIFPKLIHGFHVILILAKILARFW